MQQSGEYRIGASLDGVWCALNDPEILAQCIEGCQSMSRTAENAFSASVKAKIGPVSAVFVAEVSLADIIAPTSYTLQASVKGGAAGFAKGSAKVTLSPDGDTTVLRYEIDGNVGGKLAQIGQRLIEGAARQRADDFFIRFSEIVAPHPTEDLAIASEPPAPHANPPGVWVAVAAGLSLILAGMTYLLLGRRSGSEPD